MKPIGPFLKLIILLAVAAAGLVVSDITYSSDFKYRMEANIFERHLQSLERKAVEAVGEIMDSSLGQPDRATLERVKLLSEQSGIFLASYRNGVLESWTDNSFDLPSVYNSRLMGNRFINLGNTWLVSGSVPADSILYIYLIDVYHDFQITNQFVKPGFNPGFDLPSIASFSVDPTEGYPVRNSSDDYLFSVVFDMVTGFLTPYFVIPLVLFFLFIVFLVLLLNRVIGRLEPGVREWLAPLLIIAASLLLYLFFLFVRRPAIIDSLAIFSPYRFTAGYFIPSVGHLLMVSLILFYLSYSFFRWWPGLGELLKGGRRRSVMLSIYTLAPAAMFLLYRYMLSNLVLSSTISFEFYRIPEIDLFSITGFLSAALLLLGVILILHRLFSDSPETGIKNLFALLAPSLLLIVAVQAARGINPVLEILSFALVVLLVFLFRSRRSVLVVASISIGFVLSLYTAWFMEDLIAESERDRSKVLAVNQSVNNDPIAESLLLDMWEELGADTVLSGMMSLDYFINEDVNNIFNYLDSAYFTGFWEQYDLLYTVCNYDSPLEVSATGEEENCFDFFSRRIDDFGIPVIDSTLFLLENRSGRPYYLATLYYNREEDEHTGLFIEFISRVEYALPGYPELLQNERYLKNIQPDDYSFAKYIRDSLVLQAGNHPFNLRLTLLPDTSADFTIRADKENEYLLYRHSGDVTVVVVRPVLNFQNIVINFTYIFIIYFLLITLVYMMISPPGRPAIARFDFRQKLQYTFIVILLVSITGIGSVVVSLSIAQYRNKHLDNLEEKLSSVYIELEHKLAGESRLSGDWSQDSYVNLDALLVKFSNVFYTDINLYTTDGRLLATSRREIFERNLKGRRMDYRAFAELKLFGESQFIQEESVGELKYLSAYTPFTNYNNEVLAYLNLPYFAIQDRLSEEISNLVVTIINFSLILIVITMGITIFIAVRITSPLRMLGEGLASVSLDGGAKRLEYQGHDEIAELVNQYNRMLGQLHESAIKLARSEREDAWRDMAKQIAHEIKNPLTPMKLNVQQLQKAWRDDPGDFDERLARFTESMIENIDNLSSIATEFSSFARMPKANPRETDLVTHIRSAAELFRNIRNIEINLDFNKITSVIIWADKEQITSMLTNLIRNSVQAIPPSRKGIVTVALNLISDRVEISVTDNGIGIAPDLGEKLFAPNFTTKSSGMGIGLALVKRIVESAGGRIRYRSEVNRGTTFYIDFPLLSASGN